MFRFHKPGSTQTPVLAQRNPYQLLPSSHCTHKGVSVRKYGSISSKTTQRTVQHHPSCFTFGPTTLSHQRHLRIARTPVPPTSSGVLLNLPQLLPTATSSRSTSTLLPSNRSDHRGYSNNSAHSHVPAIATSAAPSITRGGAVATAMPGMISVVSAVAMAAALVAAILLLVAEEASAKEAPPPPAPPESMHDEDDNDDDDADGEENNIDTPVEESTTNPAVTVAAPSESEGSFAMWFKLLLPEMPLFILSLGIATLSSLISLTLPRLMGRVIDMMKSDAGLSDLSIAIGGLGTISASPVVMCLGLLLSQALLQFAFSSVLSIAAESMSTRLRKSLFAALIRKDITFFDASSTGELISSVSSDVQEVRSAVKHTISMGIKSTTQIVGGMVSLFLISPRLTTIMGLLLPTLILTGTVYARFLQKLSKRVQHSLAKSTSVAEESMSNVRTVRAFANEQLEDKRYGKQVDLWYDLAKQMGMAIGLFQGMYNVGTNGVVMGVLLYGAKLVSLGEMTSGALTSYVLYTMSLQHSMSTMSILQGELVKGFGAANRIFSLIHSEPAIPIAGGKVLDSVAGNITFQGVSFSYPTRSHLQVLKGVDIQFEEGKVYALVGPSGSGKSTIAWLIERFYDPQGGKVLIDGHDIRELDPSWLRKQIGLVSQEPVLFASSIADNIRFGKPDASQEEIEAAARMANADSFINRFPARYDTVVGERGVQLSGGEKQRIAIARALLKNAKILILDEATSALDAESEKSVQQALQRLMAGRTVVLIAHRLSTVQDADEILVLKNGNIIEKGKHHHLMDKGGIYYHLVSKQLQHHDSKP